MKSAFKRFRHDERYMVLRNHAGEFDRELPGLQKTLKRKHK